MTTPRPSATARPIATDRERTPRFTPACLDGHPTSYFCLQLGLLALAVAILLPCASASAGQARLFSGTFGGASTTTPNPYPLGPAGEAGIAKGNSLAADASAGPSSGDVYVTDSANHRVEKFNSSGDFLLMFGTEEIGRASCRERV